MILQMVIAHNDDLLTAIFIYLPPKSLIRFQLVCKHWLSLISSDYLSHQHTLHYRHRQKPEHSLLLVSEKLSNYFYLHINQKLLNQKLISYHFSPSLIEQTVVSFSNGLFLLKCPNIKNLLEECHIYNPTTKQSRKIVLNVNERYTFVVGLNLAFDPSKSPHYKIVCVRSTRRRSTSFIRCWWRFCRIEVYESETNAWRISGEPFWAPTDVDFNRGVYLNGCVHWAGMFFHLDDSIVGDHPKIEVPGGTRFEEFYVSYAESCGYLHYIAHFPKRNSIMVFELESDYSEWSLKYRVDHNSFSGLMSVLDFVREEKEEDSALVLHEPGKVKAYELKEEKSRELVDFRDEAFYEEGCVQFVSNGTFRFVETLARV
ncbi:F-box protein at5g07610 [Phtheirospermum japonicum]|uniref:F-box protein at5g07610 n=1 Tax=Phtheirospermum japonicum TaxID=374723 RepID=A0A830CDB1_9LAMI|nr:F-box protein at5g07610 [Phtheirospermum japonicum]